MIARARSRRTPSRDLTDRTKGRVFALATDDFIDAMPRDRGDAGIGFNDGGQLRRLRERFEIVADQFGPGRKSVGCRRSPAVPIEECRRGRVDAVAPGREDADMAPIAHVCADRGPAS